VEKQGEMGYHIRSSRGTMFRALVLEQMTQLK